MKLKSRVDTSTKSDRATAKPRTLYPPYYAYSVSRFVFVLLWVLKMVSLHKKDPVDVIHCQDTGYAGLAAVVSGKILKIPVIITSHGIRHKTIESTLTGMSAKLYYKIEYYLDIFSVRKANFFITVTKSVKEYYDRIVSRKIDVVPVPIKLKSFEFSEEARLQLREELGITSKEIIIGFVGRLVPVKNLSFLIDTFAKLLKHTPYLRLIFVGSGASERDLRNYVRSKKIDEYVTFCGVRYDVGRLLSSFDIFVMPSFTEGLPTALLEAMACSRAVVCSNIPAHRELVTDGMNGLLFDPIASSELQAAIVACLNESFRKMLGDNAKRTGSMYDENLVFPTMYSFYKNAINMMPRSATNYTVP